jgi:hypothetical protein
MATRKRRINKHSPHEKRPTTAIPAFDAAAFRVRLRDDVLTKDFGGSRVAFARAIGAHPSRLSAWIPKYGEHRAENSLPGSDALFRICAAANRSAHWLLFNTGPERPDLTRTEAKLADEVAVEIGSRVRTILQNDPATPSTWQPRIAGLFFDGAGVLQRAAERETEHVRRTYADFDERVERPRRQRSLELMLGLARDQTVELQRQVQELQHRLDAKTSPRTKGRK